MAVTHGKVRKLKQPELNNRNALGLTSIPVTMFENNNDILVRPFTLILNQSFEQGIFPGIFPGILRRSQITAKGKGLWIFNSSLTLNKEFVEKMKEHMSTCLNLPEKENILDDQVRWEYLKYEVRKFSIKFSKVQAKKLRLESVLLEKKTKKRGK